MKRSRLKPRSKKMSKIYVERRKLVAKMLKEQPHCSANIDGVCSAIAVAVPELLARSQGGSILDPENCETVCRPGHTWSGDNPARATALGLRRRRYGNS